MSGYRRSRSNDGTPNSVSRVLPIAPGLLASLLAEFAEVRKARVVHVYHGPKPARGAPPVKLTDEQVLALRKMRDWHGMTLTEICAATGLPEGSVTPIINWCNRVHLDPGPRPAANQKAAA